MSIRQIATELYRAKQQVEHLEKELAAAPSSRQDEIEERLRMAKAELKQMENIMEGAKTPPPPGWHPQT